jgi:hypothetical protein
MAGAIRALAASFLALALIAGLIPGIAPSTAQAAGCLRIVGGNFDAPGNDNYASHLNGEYVRVKNVCSSSRSLSGYRLNDYGRKHTYSFPSSFRLGAGRTVTVYSGRGSRTSSKLFWGRTYGAVWNNKPPERAYLRNGAGTVVSSWSEY